MGYPATPIVKDSAPLLEAGSATIEPLVLLKENFCLCGATEIVVTDLSLEEQLRRSNLHISPYEKGHEERGVVCVWCRYGSGKER